LVAAYQANQLRLWVRR